MERWQRLSAGALPGVRRAGGLFEVRYAPRPGLLDELGALVAAERECCRFVSWSVASDGEGAVLRVLAPPGEPDNVAPIAAMMETLGVS